MHLRSTNKLIKKSYIAQFFNDDACNPSASGSRFHVVGHFPRCESLSPTGAHDVDLVAITGQHRCPRPRLLSSSLDFWTNSTSQPKNLEIM